MRGRPPTVPVDKLRVLRQWRATPRPKRRRSLVGMAALLSLPVGTAKRAAYGVGCYGRQA
jgi:hypothetical protein